MDLLLSNSYYLKYEPMEGARAQPYPSLGILYIASYLRERGKWEVGVFDSTFADGVPAYEAAVKRFRPRVVGIQGIITTRRLVRRMISIAKQMGAIVVVGGPDPSACYDQYLQWGADFVVVGEGEFTISDLMSHLTAPESEELVEIPGLAYWNEGQVKLTAPRKRIPDLDVVPFPAYDLINVERYLEVWRTHNGYSSMHITTSRGCPFACEWCSHAVFGRSLRQRSVENVVAEMRFLRDRYNPDHLTFADDTFGLDQKWLFRWCDEIERQGLQIPFRCFARADIVNAEMLRRLRAVGCCHIYLGVESGSQRVLDWMHKGTIVQDIRRASRQIREAGIDLGYFIMFAYPGENRDDIRKTEQLIFEINPESLGLSIAYPVPGTPFYERVKDHLVHRQEEKTDVQMGSGRKLVFQAMYPGVYYRRLIQYIERRRSLNQPNQSSVAWFFRAIRICPDLMILRGIEWFWSTFFDKDAVKANVIS